METKDQVEEMLNDLVKINNDRIAGYEKAIEEAKDLDVDLKATFRSMIAESQTYKKELVDMIEIVDEDDSFNDTTISGKIYRAWMDVKATFSGNDRKAILENCEFGEDAWRRAYEGALNNADVEITENVRNLIMDQYNSQRSSHDLIKKYRDSHSQ